MHERELLPTCVSRVGWPNQRGVGEVTRQRKQRKYQRDCGVSNNVVAVLLEFGENVVCLVVCFCGVLVERLATHYYERTLLLLPCLFLTGMLHDAESGLELLSYFLLASLGLLAGGWGCAG